MTNETTMAATSFAEQLYRAWETESSSGAAIRAQLLSWLAEHGLAYLFNILASIVILFVGAFAIRLIVAAVGTAVEKHGPRTLFGNFIRSATAKLAWAVLIVIILGKLGVNITPIVTGLGVTGFIFGFAFQESLGNLAAGLMIAVNEPFKIGDYVIISGFEGRVLKMDMMATVLATSDNKKIVIANKTAWNSPITNFSALGRRRVDIKIGIDYSCDVVKAIRVALETLPTVPGVLTEPAPVVCVASLDDSQVTLNIRPWAEGPDYWKVHSGTQMAIKSAFERNGIDIPFPQLTVHTDA